MSEPTPYQTAVEHVREKALQFVDEHGFKTEGPEFMQLRVDLFEVLSFSGKPKILEEVLLLATTRRLAEADDADTVGEYTHSPEYGVTKTGWLAEHDDVIAERIGQYIGFNDLTYSTAGRS